MIRYRDIPAMSIRDLCDLAEQVRLAKPGTRKMRQLADRMGAATTYLEDSGALGQLLWWGQDVEPEAPPDAKVTVVEFVPTKAAPFLV